MKAMVKRGLALALVLLMVMGMTTALAGGAPVAINQKNFPDTAFRKYVTQFDKNKDGHLSTSEIKKVTDMELSDDCSAIKSLKGVEYFNALQTLVICGTSVKVLDLRENSKLAALDISGTSLKTLKITGLKNLNWVDATSKNLASLDIAGCTKLLSSVKQPWYFEGDTVDWYGSAMFWTSKNTKLMNGSKLLRQ